ncbi:MAG: A24 family peptidase [Anaerolineae bacterium]|nr:A24 family peptidase [Anaerolineae bacterium]MDW8071121.1 A24 family peptidase [Anaerolineae bacterium]
MSFETLFYALFGWFIGVLINHAADVLPRHRALSTVPVCPHCAIPRAPLAWSAVLGYLSRRYICLGCGRPIPFRPVFVELATPLLFVGLLWRYGFSVQLGLISLYSVVLILVTVTDLEHRLIQHVVMVPALLIALVGAFLNRDMTARQAVLGGAVALALFYAMYLLASPVGRLISRLTGRPSEEVPFGFGDVTLATFVGLITGIPGVIVALILTIFSAGLVAAGIVLVQVLRHRYRPLTTIPYGPFLALGGFIVMIYGPEILSWYLRYGT